MFKSFKSVTLLLFVALALLLAACSGASGGGGGTTGGPQITSFTANPANVAAAGTPVTLSWQITGSVTGLEIDNGVGSVNGTSTIVYPTATTTYTLTATNSSGSSTQSATVTLGGSTAPGVEDGALPAGDFGVSLTQDNFQSDGAGNITSPTDPRVVTVAPNSTFYALVSYQDVGGIAGVRIRLANSSPAGFGADLIQGQSVGGFTLNGEVSGCILDGTQTAVTCIYEIAVGNIGNITSLPGAGGEFAYVLRTNVRDVAGNESDSPPRGYVVVGGSGGTPSPTPNPDPDPTTNRAPSAGFSFQQQAGTLAVTFSAQRSSDPDGDSLQYSWNFGDGSSASTRDFRKTFGSAGNKTVSLTVTDPAGLKDTETKTVPVAAAGNPDPEPEPTPGRYALTVTKASNGSGTVTGTGINCGSDCTETLASGTIVTLTAAPSADSTFAGWGGACTNATGTCQVTMNAIKNVSASFNLKGTTPTSYALTVTKPINGTVSSSPAGISCGDDCTESYSSNVQVTLTANPANGYKFDGWSGDCIGMTCVLTMNAIKSVTAAFSAVATTPTKYPLNVTKPANGTVSSNPTGISCGDDCIKQYDANASVTLTVTPAQGFKFDG